MNDLPSLAQQARANLAQALSALQEDNVPPKTQALASIVAEAMNLLHRIEKNHDVAGFDRWDHSTRALLLVRTALNNLQAPDHSHPATEGVLEPAAQAVRLVHQLNQLTAKRESDPPQPESLAPTDPAPLGQKSEPVAEAPAAAHVEAPPSRVASSEPILPPPGQLDTEPETKQSSSAIPGSASVSSVSVSSVDVSSVSASSVNASSADASSLNSTSVGSDSVLPGTEVPLSPRVEVNHEEHKPDPQAVTAESVVVAPFERASSNPERISTNPVALPALEPLPGEVYVEVALGAYSTSNFYRLLQDADVVDGGGLFVATYAPPELSQSVRIRATLTGGFVFEGRGTVDWRREMPKSGSLNPLMPPGFGLKFTELSDAARKMVHRYSRSREPFVRDADAT